MLSSTTSKGQQMYEILTVLTYAAVLLAIAGGAVIAIVGLAAIVYRNWKNK